MEFPTAYINLFVFISFSILENTCWETFYHAESISATAFLALAFFIQTILYTYSFVDLFLSFYFSVILEKISK